eukprot:756596-Hanusia_phi.AAC.4
MMWGEEPHTKRTPVMKSEPPPDRPSPTLRVRSLPPRVWQASQIRPVPQSRPMTDLRRACQSGQAGPLYPSPSPVTCQTTTLPGEHISLEPSIPAS